MANLHASLFSLSAERGDQIALKLQKEAGGYRSVSYKNYRDQALRLSHFLKNKGIGPGDHVLLVSENAPEWTMVALAVMNLGATLVPVASIASILEIQNIVKGAKPKFSFVSIRCSAARQIAKELDSSAVYFWDLQTRQPIERLVEGLDPIPVNVGISEDEIALLIYTSGTTGTPKAVPISHRNVLVNARDSLEVIKASSNDRLVSVLPLSHMFEFTGGFVVAMLIGAQITYTKSLRPEDLLKAMKDTKATILIAVPLLFEIIARNLQSHLEEMPKALKSYFRFAGSITRSHPRYGKFLFYPIHKVLGGHVRYFMAGGSRLHPQVFEFYRDLGFLVLQGYGLTETSPVLTVTSEKNAAPDHVGHALGSIELGIFSDNGEPLPNGVEGEIWAKGPSIFKGYVDRAHNEGVFFADWFRTGDLGNLDKDGLLRITGRKKDIIVTPAGKNVYPEEIEGVVLATGKFLEVAVLGINDGAGHEKICLALVPDRSKFPSKSKEEITREALKIAGDVTRTLSDYKWPQRVEILFEEMPKTSTRKIKKHEVRKILLVGSVATDAAPKSTTNGLRLEDDLERTLAEALAHITHADIASIACTASLTKDLGLDSLTFIELVSAVEKKFGTQVEGVDFATILTLEDLVKILRAGVGAKRRRGIFNHVFFSEFSPEHNLKLVWKLPRRFLNVALRAYLKIRHNLTVEGLENIQDHTPYIFAPNHTSHFDMLSIAASVPGFRVHSTFAVAAKDYFFNSSLKSFIARAFINALPFDRKGRVDESMAKCRDVLDEGCSLTIFPEGTRSPDGKLQAFKPGVGQLLAGHPHAMAVPVYIEGAFEIMPKGKSAPGPGNLKIRYGKPISFRDLPPMPESYKKIADRLREEVIKLANR